MERRVGEGMGVRLPSWPPERDSWHRRCDTVQRLKAFARDRESASGGRPPALSSCGSRPWRQRPSATIMVPCPPYRPPCPSSTSARILPCCASGCARSLTRSGFFYLTGHGVPEQLTERLLTEARRLFALPQAEKDAVAMRNSPHFRGYTRLGGELTGGVVDWREQIDIGPQRAPDRGRRPPGLPVAAGSEPVAVRRCRSCPRWSPSGMPHWPRSGEHCYGTGPRRSAAARTSSTRRSPTPPRR